MVPGVGREAAFAITTAMYGSTIAPAMHTHRTHPDVTTASGRQTSLMPIMIR